MTTGRFFIAATIGLLAGITGGLFGVGGGIIVVPGLVLLLRYEPHRAHPTSGAAIVVTAGAALIRFGADGSVDWAAGVALFAGAGIGALVGAQLLDRISARWLTGAFVLVLAISAVRLLLPNQATASEIFVTSVDLTVLAVAGLLTAGIVAGVMAATLGLGGGVVFVPTLAALYLVDQHVAQGTSLAAMVPTTIVAAVIHGRAGRIDWPVAAALGVGGIVGALTGAGWALDLDPLLLRRLFGGLLVFVAARMLASLVRSSDSNPPSPAERRVL
jgi:uncharacterized membrane protein YfcA